MIEKYWNKAWNHITAAFLAVIVASGDQREAYPDFVKILPMLEKHEPHGRTILLHIKLQTWLPQGRSVCSWGARRTRLSLQSGRCWVPSESLGRKPSICGWTDHSLLAYLEECTWNSREANRARNYSGWTSIMG